MPIIIKEAAAGKTICPMARNEAGDLGCLGSKCAAWTYLHDPIVSNVRVINAAQAKAKGILKRESLSLPDEKEVAAALIADAYSNFYTHFAEIKVTSDDFGPIPEGWTESQAPYYDEDEGAFFQELTREYDPAAVGFCGMVNVPHMSGGCQGGCHGA